MSSYDKFSNKKNSSKSMFYLIIKRLLDLTIAMSGLFLLAPLLIIISAWIKIKEGGDVLYFQKRMGYKNQPFYLWKYRTMIPDSTSKGSGALTLGNDPRITPSGRFLRAYKLDEIPQVMNVVKGDISIVGPRPVPIKNYEAYPENVKRRVYDSPPGITGIGSLIFRREGEILADCGEDPNVFYKNEIAPYKAALELWYHKNASLWMDFKIMLLTIWVVFNRNDQVIFNFFESIPQHPLFFYRHNATPPKQAVERKLEHRTNAKSAFVDRRRQVPLNKVK